MRKRFVLLKDVYWAKAGTIIEEKCDDGTQDYKAIDVVPQPYLVALGYDAEERVLVTKLAVENSPEFFQEVKPLYVSAEKIKQVEKFIKSLK